MFADDALQCACGGRRNVIAVVTDPDVARTLILGIARGRERGRLVWEVECPQVEFAWDDQT